MTTLVDDPVNRNVEDRRSLASNRLKRLFDIIAACILLAMSLPVLLVLFVAIRITSPGPALFRQVRVGARGRRFMMVKFRSMRHDAEQFLNQDAELHQRYLANGNKLRLDEDPRVTRLGRFIRRASIDELPQLWNVIRGDMSLVGPRPVLESELGRYGDQVDAYLATRPGLTGLWQVSGRSDLSYADRIALDASYIESWSFLKDVCIMVRTVGIVLSCRGAS